MYNVVSGDELRFIEENHLYMSFKQLDKFYENYINDLNKDAIENDRIFKPTLVDRKIKAAGLISYKKKFRECQFNAFRRKISFNLSFEEWKHVVTKNCIYCGIEPHGWNYYLKADKKLRVMPGVAITDKVIESATIYINGVDRCDNNIGYTLENSIPCCTSCNIAKGSYPVDEFIAQTKARFLMCDSVNQRIREFTGKS